MSSSSSNSSSGSSSGSDSDSDERRKKRKHRKEKKEKKEQRRREKKKREKKEKRKHKKEKHKKHHKEVVQRSVITGKKLKREERDDAAGDARRQAMLAQMNEGEDEQVASSFCSRPGVSSHQETARTQAQRALSDPALMLELMRKSADTQAAKKQRLAALMGGGGGGGSLGVPLEDAPGAPRQKNPGPRNYKQERLAREQEEL